MSGYIRELCERFLSLFRRRKLDSDLSEELASHIEMAVADNIRAGMNPDEARRQAMIRLGGVEAAKELHRDARGLPLIESFAQDIHYAFRTLHHSLGFTFVAVLILALGVGVNTSMFTLLDALLLRPLPVPEPQRVLTILRGDHRPCSYLDYLDFRDRVRAFTGLAADLPNEGGIEANEKVEVGQIEGVSYNYAQVLESKALVGRWFSPGDEQVNHDDSLAVISYRMWHILFYDDPQVVGKMVKIDGSPFTIIGVAPKELLGMSQPMVTDAWVPLDVYARHNKFVAGAVHNRQGSLIAMFGRLKSRITEAQALAEMNSIDGQLRQEYLYTESNRGILHGEVVRGVSDPGYRRGASQLAVLLMAVAVMVLLITCANIGSLLLARGLVRHREISIRVALGAGRMRIVQQMIVESLCLAAMGSAVGLLAAIGVNRFLELRIAEVPLPVSIGLSLGIDRRILLFAFCAALLTTLVFGTLPAIAASRPDLVPALKGDESAARNRVRWFSSRRLYVIGQISISLMLLVVSGLFIHALENANRMETGFDVHRLLSARLYMAPAQFTEPAARELLGRTVDWVTATPGVRSASVSYDSPFISSSDCISRLTPRIDLRPQAVGSNIVGTDYFATLGVPLVAGRAFSKLDVENSPRVLIVNNTLSERYFPGESAVGKQLRVGCDCRSGQCYDAEIVGVVKDAKFANLDEPTEPYVFVPITQRFARYVSLLIRTNGEPAQLARGLGKELRAMDPRLQVYDVDTFAYQLDQSFWLLRWETSLLGGLGALALLLAAVGLYGIISTSVTQRTKEIGIRMALGARRGDVMRLILAGVLGFTMIGVVIGLAGSLLVTRLIRGHLYGLSPMDPIVYVASALLWAVVALFASYIPVRHAMRVDPTVTLRYE